MSDPATETIWFAGHWGFQFYAERAGMRALIPEQSQLSEGDWLVVPAGFPLQAFSLAHSEGRLVDRIELRSPWPWTSIPSAYSGPVALRSQPPVHVRVSIFRIRRDFTPSLPLARE